MIRRIRFSNAANADAITRLLSPDVSRRGADGRNNPTSRKTHDLTLSIGEHTSSYPTWIVQTLSSVSSLLVACLMIKVREGHDLSR
jgi:hypothetical protein